MPKLEIDSSDEELPSFSGELPSFSWEHDFSFQLSPLKGTLVSDNKCSEEDYGKPVCATQPQSIDSVPRNSEGFSYANQTGLSETQNLHIDERTALCVDIPDSGFIFPVWPNDENDSLSWLNASISLLVCNRKLKKYICTNNNKRSLLKNICLIYYEALNQLNALNTDVSKKTYQLHLSTLFHVKNKLKSVQKEALQFLWPKLRKYESKDFPVLAIQNLLQEDTAINSLFLAKYGWDILCKECGAHVEERKEDTVIELIEGCFNFCMEEPYYQRSCTFCNAVEQKNFFHFLGSPPKSILLHFHAGSSDLNLADLRNSSSKKNKYEVTGIVQNVLHRSHFVTWIRNPFDESWLWFDDLGPGYQQYSSGTPQILGSEIIFVMWEHIEAEDVLLPSDCSHASSDVNKDVLPVKNHLKDTCRSSFRPSEKPANCLKIEPFSEDSSIFKFKPLNLSEKSENVKISRFCSTPNTLHGERPVIHQQEKMLDVENGRRFYDEVQSHCVAKTTRTYSSTFHPVTDSKQNSLYMQGHSSADVHVADTPIISHKISPIQKSAFASSSGNSNVPTNADCAFLGNENDACMLTQELNFFQSKDEIQNSLEYSSAKDLSLCEAEVPSYKQNNLLKSPPDSVFKSSSIRDSRLLSIADELLEGEETFKEIESAVQKAWDSGGDVADRSKKMKFTKLDSSATVSGTFHSSDSHKASDNSVAGFTGNCVKRQSKNSNGLVRTNTTDDQKKLASWHRNDEQLCEAVECSRNIDTFQKLCKVLHHNIPSTLQIISNPKDMSKETNVQPLFVPSDPSHSYTGTLNDKYMCVLENVLDYFEKAKVVTEVDTSADTVTITNDTKVEDVIGKQVSESSGNPILETSPSVMELQEEEECPPILQAVGMIRKSDYDKVLATQSKSYNAHHFSSFSEASLFSCMSDQDTASSTKSRSTKRRKPVPKKTGVRKAKVKCSDTTKLNEKTSCISSAKYKEIEVEDFPVCPEPGLEIEVSTCENGLDLSVPPVCNAVSKRRVRTPIAKGVKLQPKQTRTKCAKQSRAQKRTSSKPKTMGCKNDQVLEQRESSNQPNDCHLIERYKLFTPAKCSKLVTPPVPCTDSVPVMQHSVYSSYGLLQASYVPLHTPLSEEIKIPQNSSSSSSEDFIELNKNCGAKNSSGKCFQRT